MNILVIGRSGQVAQSLLRQSAGHAGLNLVFVGRHEVDLEDPGSVVSAIVVRRPDTIINVAAYTAVDRAEREPQVAFTINRDGAQAVAEAAAHLGVPLLHLSTDYVYSGWKVGHYQEADDTGPLNVYGQSKLAGEQAVLSALPDATIIRTAWIYSPFGTNFVKTMLRLGAERPLIRVVDDQTGSPTSALDLASALLKLAQKMPVRGGIYHLAGGGTTSWFAMARHIFETSSSLGGPSPTLQPISSADYGAVARRPANSVLDCGLAAGLLGIRLPIWQSSVATVVTELIGGNRDSS